MRCAVVGIWKIDEPATHLAAIFAGTLRYIWSRVRATVGKVARCMSKSNDSKQE